MGLNYNASTATWNFTNEANDFIDTDSFSSKDPDFKFASTEDKDDDTEKDTKCPAGYIYDNTLKQCIPEPQQFRISGGEKDENGNLVINLERGSIGSAIVDNLFGKVSPTKLNTQLHKQQKIISLLIDKGIINQMDAYPQGGISATDPNAGSMQTKFVIPTIKAFEAEYYNLPMPNVIVPGWDNTIYGKQSSVQKFDSYMANKLAAFKTVANNAISNYKRGDTEYQIKEQELNDIEKEKARKAKFDADQAEIKANQEKIKMQKTIREKEQEQQEFENLSNLKQGESYTDTSGDTYTKVTSGDKSGSSGQGFRFTPSSGVPIKTKTSTKTYENKRRGGYTGSTAGRGGTVDMKTPTKKSKSKPSGKTHHF